MQESAKKLDALRKKCRVSYLLCAAGLLAAFVLMLLGQSKAGLAVLALMLLAWFLLYRTDVRNYTAVWREVYMNAIAGHCLEGLSYSYKADAARLRLREYALLPGGEKGWLARSMITGRRKTLNALLCDLTMPLVKNKSVTMLSGGFLRFSADAAGESGVVFRAQKKGRQPEKEPLSLHTDGLLPCPPPPGMPEDVQIYTPSGALDCTEDVAIGLKRLMKCAPGAVLAELRGNSLTVQLPHRLFFAYPPSLKYPITPAMLESIRFEELEQTAKLAEAALCG